MSSDLTEPPHFGNFGGPALKLVYALSGLTSAFLSIIGFLLWRLKRRRGIRLTPAKVNC